MLFLPTFINILCYSNVPWQIKMSDLHVSKNDHCQSVILISSFVWVHSALFESDVKAVWDYSNSVDQYSSIGGTALSSVKQQITDMTAWLASVKGTPS